MSTLTLHLFGRPEIRLDGTPITGLSRKALAIVYYLATTRQRSSREMLAGLLWSDYTEDRARGNLRVELGKLRRKLGDHIHIQRHSAAFDFHSNHELDVGIFEANLNRPQPTAEQIEEAVAHYRGDFLADFSLRGAPLFEEWQLTQQERLRQLALGSLQRLATGYGEQKLYDGAITAVRRLLEIEPWSEAGHRDLMRWLALSGQRWAALEQCDRCRDTLAEELGADPDSETEALYQQIIKGELKADPDAAPLDVSHALETPAQSAPFQPLPLTDHFVGREAEIEQLKAQLTQPDGPHLVALVGMGGIGKTTLANQMSHALRDTFADGVLWADAAASEPLDILESWGAAYGYDFSGLSDIKNRAAAVRGMLADKQVLLVLDDVVRVSRIRPLIPNGSQCAVLLTTRNLDVATALNAEPLLVGELLLENGRNLLTQILGAERVQAEPEAADEICMLLQLHPLALEIAAMRLKARRRQSLAAMARRLQVMDQRLGLEISDRAVRASFAVSWEGLDGELRNVFARLAAFEIRPFTTAAAAYVADLDEFDTEDDLFSLTALSLLREVGEEHYRLHQLLADFAHEKIGDGIGEINGRMATYYHRLAQEYEGNYAVFDSEWNHMLAGMRAAHDQEMWPLVIDYANTLINPWFQQARYGDIPKTMPLVQKAAQALQDKPTLAYMQMKWGQACIEQNRYQEANTQLEKALETFTDLEEVARIAEINFNLARIGIEQNRHEEALAWVYDSREIYETLGDPIGIAKTYHREARIMAASGSDLQEAEQLAKEALYILEEEGEAFWQANCLRFLAELSVINQAHEQAEQYCQAAYELSNAQGNKGELAAITYLLTAVYRLQEKFDESIAYAEEGLELFKQSGNIRSQGLILYELGRTLKEANKIERALEICQEALPVFAAVLEDRGIFYIRLLWGDCLMLQNKSKEAFEQWQQAQDLAETLSNAMLLQLIEQRFLAHK
ncbi:MAG: BTAD domain-containing putative transcriptional regulator [Chloroflexota bacterium]